MRLFALVAVLVLAGCATPEPLAPAPQTVSVEPATAAATPSDDPTANCDLPDDVKKDIENHLKAIEALNAQSRFEHTDRHLDVIEIQEHLEALVQRASNECVQKGYRSLPSPYIGPRTLAPSYDAPRGT